MSEFEKDLKTIQILKNRNMKEGYLSAITRVCNRIHYCKQNRIPLYNDYLLRNVLLFD